MGGVANFFQEIFSPKDTSINTKKENQQPDEDAARAAEEERKRRAAAGGGLSSKGSVAGTLSGATGASTLGGGS